MLFFEFSQRRMALPSSCKWTAIWLHMALWLAFCGTGMAQTATPVQDSIKKAIQAGQLDQALKLVQQERGHAPQDVQIRFMEGVIHAQQGQTDKAIDTFRKITESHPDLSEAHNNLGVLYAAKGQLEESKIHLEKALQTHPSYAVAHRNLSDVHSQLARQSYAKALQVDAKTKISPPQLTLLGSIANDKRIQTSSTAATNKPSASSESAALVKTAPAVSAPMAQAKPETPPQNTVKAAALPASAAIASAAVPSAMPAPPSAPASKPAPDKDNAERTAIKHAVTAWANAWSQKDMPKYLAAYADTFSPSEKMSRTKWENERRLRIVSKKTIAIGINHLQITLYGNKATVRFQQIYESDNFKGNSRKTLDMHKQGSQWLIVRETVN